MQCAAYLFVNRRWEDDEKHLKTMMKYFAKLNYKTQVRLQIVQPFIQFIDMLISLTFDDFWEDDYFSFANLCITGMAY